MGGRGGGFVWICGGFGVLKGQREEKKKKGRESELSVLGACLPCPQVPACACDGGAAGSRPPAVAVRCIRGGEKKSGDGRPQKGLSAGSGRVPGGARRQSEISRGGRPTALLMPAADMPDSGT